MCAVRTQATLVEAEIMKPAHVKASRLAWVLAGTIVACIVLYQIRNALLPFIIGGALAYTLDPLVSWLDARIPWLSSRPGHKRVLLILVIFVAAVLVFSAALIAAMPHLVTEFRQLMELLPQLIRQSGANVQKWNAQALENVPLEMQEVARDSLQQAGEEILDSARDFAIHSVGLLFRTMILVLGLAVVPLILFYLLRDKNRIEGGLLSLFPPEWHRHTREILGILNDTFGAYVRLRVQVGVLTGLSVSVGLLILDVRFAPVLGLVAGISAMVPVIGLWIGAVPTLMVLLATAPGKILGVALFYLLVQILQHLILLPRVHNSSMKLHPVMVLAALFVGMQLAGLWGFILGPPVAAAVRRIILYFIGEASGDNETHPAAAADPDNVPTSSPTDSGSPTGCV